MKMLLDDMLSIFRAVRVLMLFGAVALVVLFAVLNMSDPNLLSVKYLLADFGYILKLYLYCFAGIIVVFTGMKRHDRKNSEKDQRTINTEIVDAAQLKKIMRRRNLWRASNE